MSTTVVSDAASTPIETVTSFSTVINTGSAPTTKIGFYKLVTTGSAGAPLELLEIPTIIPATQSPNSTSQDTTSQSSISSIRTSPSSSQSAVLSASSHSKTHSTSTTVAPGHPDASHQSPEKSSNHSLSNGTVAGIVVASAIGLALITFLLTFMVMRHRRRQSDRYQQDLKDPQRSANGKPARESLHNPVLEPKASLVTQTSNSSNEFETHLPQSADDTTLRNNVKTLLDQVELHVENFYQNVSRSGSRSNDSRVTMFDSQSLQHPLSALLMRSSAALPLIKHALIYFITAKISLNGQPDSTFLPDEFITLPGAITAVDSGIAAKPGFAQCISRWRVLTAYLRPFPTHDQRYAEKRDHQIRESLQAWAQAFGPWRNLKYADEDQVQSLSAIFKSAAELGVWLFSQPSDIQFRWPEKSETGQNRVAVSPALVKKSDERGRSLDRPQVMIEAVLERLK